jgi:hypothetical protein
MLIAMFGKKPKLPSTQQIFLEGLKTHGTRFEFFVFKYRRWLAFATFVLAVLFTVLTADRSGLRETRNNSAMQNAHAIGLALYSYANDHDGHYPEGKTSTQVFQQLVDQGYVTDPSLFYLPMPGKTPAHGKGVLRPENICWDFTAGTRLDDQPNVPLIYSTGCKVSYTSGGTLHAPDNSPFGAVGMVVFYVSNAAAFVPAKADGGISIFQPAFDPKYGPAYDPKGKNYVQLTP